MVDGTPDPESDVKVGSMQMVNHSCAPNCKAGHQDFGQGLLGICFLITSRDIQDGEQITFCYGGTSGKVEAPKALSQVEK